MQYFRQKTDEDYATPFPPNRVHYVPGDAKIIPSKSFSEYTGVCYSHPAFPTVCGTTVSDFQLREVDEWTRYFYAELCSGKKRAGFYRNLMTSDKSKVTCKHCLEKLGAGEIREGVKGLII